MEKPVELALRAGRLRQSPKTGFIHEGDTIPLLENYAFALSLLRSRQVDFVLEAKSLLEKLLPFGLSVHLHEFPLERDSYLGRRLYPYLFWTLREFSSILGEELRTSLQNRLALLSKPTLPENPQTPQQWADYLIVCQLDNLDPTPALRQWDPHAFAFVGSQSQEKYEPAVTLYDLFVPELSRRALEDHPIHIKASVIRPWDNLSFPSDHKTSPYLWGSQKYTHSLWVPDNFVLPERDVENEIEFALYLDGHPDHKITIENQKATTFHLGEKLQVAHFEISFEVEGEGAFFGHISRGNRPGQLSATKFDAYDWKIALRTVWRKGSVELSLYTAQHTLF